MATCTSLGSLLIFRAIHRYVKIQHYGTSLTMSGISELCRSCKTITFDDIESGFTHPLTYEQNLINGSFCRFCKLMVYSFSKLQALKNPYELENNYDKVASQLRVAPAISRIAICEKPFVIDLLHQPPKHLQWQPFTWEQSGKLKGAVCDGATIQANAPDESLYLKNGYVRTREVIAADSEKNFSALHKWLNDCIKHHKKCKRSFSGEVHDEQSSPPLLPRRVIYTGSVDDCRSPRLEEGGGRRGKYFTLSHRWGKRKLSFTTSSTLADNYRRLALETLPCTFRDAILATRRLGIRYIWIDALCIVQDDPDEWREQSALMGSIFENSTCTLAAVDALENEDSEDNGLFLARPVNPLAVEMNIPFTKTLAERVISRVPAFKGYPCVWKFKWLTEISGGSMSDSHCNSGQLDTVISRNRLVLRPRIMSSYYKMDKSVWARRGWVMQERVLSRRIIYFTKEKLYWDCLKISEEEQHAESLGSPLRALDDAATGDSEKPRRAWEFIVSEYSNTILTYNRDKLAALMGLTRSFTMRYNSENYAGIEGDATGFGLLWHAKDTFLDEYPDFHAPSWTWAAYNGPVSYNITTYADTRHALASRIKYSMDFSCPQRNNQNHCENSPCLSGLISLEAPFGITYTSGKRLYGDPSLQKDSDLLPILGHSVYREMIPIPRYTECRRLEVPLRTLSLPKHTTILSDENGRSNGWFIRDIQKTTTELGDRLVPLHFVAICSRERPNKPGQDTQQVLGSSSNYKNEICIDIILLEPAREKRSYSRIGRGRLILKAWPDHMRPAEINIV
ncbi:hypothetical protein ACMYSQ_004400 [Aspergillus niger]